MQRLFDIVLAGIALLILSPLLVPVMIVLRLTGEGEVFYRQERVGRHGALFQVLKFATMLKDSPNLGTGTVTLKDDRLAGASLLAEGTGEAELGVSLTLGPYAARFLRLP